jgi:hypothetical protein
MKYRCCQAWAGFRCPQLQIQITPLCWGLALGWGDEKLAAQVGPVAVALWFRMGTWQAEAYYDRQ